MKPESKAIYAVLLVLISGFFFAGFRASQNKVETPLVFVPHLSQEAYNQETDKLSDLLKREGLLKTFDYVQTQVDNRDDFARDCHPLMHSLGHQAFHNYSQDASAALKQANEICNAGFIHGVIQSYFIHKSDSQLKPNQLCNSQQAEWEYSDWQCFHGMGHGYMLASDSNINQAIKNCQSLKSQEPVSSCANGAFMERFFLTDHSGEVIRSLDEAHISKCQSQSNYKADCYLYAPSAYLEENLDDYLGAAEVYCDEAELEFVVICQYGVGSQLMKDLISQPSMAVSVCLQMKSEDTQQVCLKGAASGYFYNKGTTENYPSTCNEVFEDYADLCLPIAKKINLTLKI